MSREDFIAKSAIANLAGMFAYGRLTPGEVLRYDGPKIAFEAATALADIMDESEEEILS